MQALRSSSPPSVLAEDVCCGPARARAHCHQRVRLADDAHLALQIRRDIACRAVAPSLSSSRGGRAPHTSAATLYAPPPLPLRFGRIGRLVFRALHESGLLAGCVRASRRAVYTCCLALCPRAAALRPPLHASHPDRFPQADARAASRRRGRHCARRRAGVPASLGQRAGRLQGCRIIASLGGGRRRARRVHARAPARARRLNA